jgi:anti-sigma regulatory factor (Ser/Thr protein kinase)
VIVGGWRGPGWRMVDADPRHGAPVRQWVTSVIAAHGCPVDLDDAALILGELFANAVTHGPAGGRVLAGYCLWRKGARIVVCDGGGPGLPVLRHPGDQAEGGRGLRIVDELAARWGSFRIAAAQVVWCDLGQPLHAPSADAWAWLRRELSACSLAAPGVLAGAAGGPGWPPGALPALQREGLPVLVPGISYFAAEAGAGAGHADGGARP